VRRWRAQELTFSARDEVVGERTSELARGGPLTSAAVVVVVVRACVSPRSENPVKSVDDFRDFLAALSKADGDRFRERRRRNTS